MAQFNAAVVAKTVKNAVSAAEINLNRWLRREFIPVMSRTLNIETSSSCNLKCRFCAYEKKQSPKLSMRNEMFADVVGQAVALGYDNFALTPCTGDVFMDPDVFDKLEMLEAHPGVASYAFFTNFTVPDADGIARLLALRKLRQLSISIYGHDVESFRAITQSTAKVYRRLLSNLEVLHARLGERSFNLEFGFRSTRDAPRTPSTDLLQLLQRFARAGIKIRTSHVYNNWGGYVTAADVEGLAIDVTGTEQIYKNGPCALLFTAVQVMATGVVNGCACRDVDATLKIGDLRETALRDIISTGNAAYMALIDEQMRGQFRPVCRSCDFYKSIFHQRSQHRKGLEPVQSMQSFKARLDAKQALPQGAAAVQQQAGSAAN
jgi:hypothetical protein